MLIIIIIDCSKKPSLAVGQWSLSSAISRHSRVKKAAIWKCLCFTNVFRFFKSNMGQNHSHSECNETEMTLLHSEFRHCSMEHCRLQKKKNFHFLVGKPKAICNLINPLVWRFLEITAHFENI